MIEIVRAKNPKAKQPWHIRVVAEGNDQPLLAGETLVEQHDAGVAIAALGRLFSPVDRAEYAGGPSGGVLTVWIEHDEDGQKLHVPIELVDEREAPQPPTAAEPPTEPAAPAKKAVAKKTAKKAASAGGDS